MKTPMRPISSNGGGSSLFGSLHSPSSASSPSSSSSPIALTARSAFHLFGSSPLRQQLAFGTLAMCVLLLLLLLYQPPQQEGLLCGSRQAMRARMHARDPSAPRSMREVQAIQERQKQVTKSLFDRVAPTSGFVVDPPPVADKDAVESVPGRASHPFLLPLPPPRAPVSWERKLFTAPAPPEGPFGKSSGYPGAPTPEQTASNKRKWEEQFRQLLGQRGGDVTRAFHDWIAPGVDKLEVRAAPLNTVDQAIALLDGRRDPMVIFILKHTMHLLGPGWGLVIFHTAENEQWFVEQLKIRAGEPGEHIQMQRTSPIVKQQANSLPMSSLFHERVGVETVILLQPDAFMLRSPWLDGPSSDRQAFDGLLAQWGYLGAPWGFPCDEWCKLGGNGGVSMRKRSFMLDVTTELRCGDWECHRHDLFRDQESNPDAWWRTEDTYVAKVLYTHQHRWKGRIPTQEQTGVFSQEHLTLPVSISPFFVHKIWRYQDESRWLPLLAHVKQYYPDA